MLIRYWGVRGSIPAPGAHTLRHGGNTACVSVETSDAVVVLDAGSGIRRLGDALSGDRRALSIMLSHLHFDHIIGFPFFAPLFEPGREVHLLDDPSNEEHRSLIDLLGSVHCPVAPEKLSSAFTRHADAPGAWLRAQGFDVETIRLNHPGGATGYRLTSNGRSFVYMPDNELGAVSPQTPSDHFTQFCRGADVLCHDAQYRTDEMPGRRGWGHSTADEACELAVASDVAHLVLFHHDPDRDDDELDALQETCAGRLARHGIRCTVAHEGLVVDLSCAGPSA
jgi:phosphoribosyl 1,2-cyclic phosphodiesterase